MADNLLERLSEKLDPWGRNERGAYSKGPRAVIRRLYWWSQREYAIRYMPVIRELRSGQDKRYPLVLEVGFGVFGLSRFVGRKIIGVDIITEGPCKDNLFKIAADAVALPFKTNSADMVVSMDTLEHIPPEHRKKAVRELLRVARKKVYLGCPTREKAQLWEDRVRTIYERKILNWKRSAESKRKFILRNAFLSEHERYGLPREEELSQYIDECIRESGGVYTRTSFDNEHIRVWYYAVLGDMKYSYFRWAVTTLFYCIFFSLLARIKKGRCYRKIFVIEKKGNP